tara:strand:- start:393 stop:899 length:507 start_codon:yes stop_codon:yes gene_type:complete
MKTFKSFAEGAGLWANIHKKRKEGRPMRKPGSKGAPTKQDFERSRSVNASTTPEGKGFQPAMMLNPKTKSKILKNRHGKKLDEKDSKGHFRPTEKGAGMTQKGVDAYNRANPGSNLKTAVTGKVKPGSKAAKRRKSFCARSGGQLKMFPKAAKDPNSRLRQARRRWKC